MSMAPKIGGKYYDLSNPVHKGMPFYPASFPVEIEKVAKARHNVHKLTMATHHGTHVDAPRHFFNEGTGLDEMDLNKFMGEGVVLDFSYKEIGSGIGADDLNKYSDLVRADDIAILFTGSSKHLGESWINAKYTYLDRSGAEWIVQKKVKTVGIDFFSIDQYDNPENPAHNLLLGNGIPLIEEISYEARHLLNKRIYLLCLPIRVMVGDGAPARAIAYLLE